MGENDSSACDNCHLLELLLNQKSLVGAQVYVIAMDLGKMPHRSPLILRATVMAMKSSLSSFNHYTMRLVRKQSVVNWNRWNHFNSQ